MSKSKQVYVCGACGKTAATPYDFKDVSCAVNAVLCYEDSLIYNEEGRLTGAKAGTAELKTDKEGV
jgi:hypothetical protein